MNCRKAQDRIFAERDRALEENPRAEFEGHLAQCDACRRVRDDLTAAFSLWRQKTENVRVPDAEREWHAVRRKIRGGVTPETEPASRPRRSLIPWLAVPIAAAAAFAIALLTPSQTPRNRTPVASSPVARADLIEVPGNASTMVFVDEKNGWLFVMASEAPKRG